MLQLSQNDGTTYEIAHEDGDYRVNGIPAKWDMELLPNGMISCLNNGKSYTAIAEHIDVQNKEVTVRVNGQTYKFIIKEPIDQLLATMGMDRTQNKKTEPVKAPMPGMVLRILVVPGQEVQKGDGLLVLEAMKMENILKATAPATVKLIKAVERTAVEKGAILIELQ